MPLFKLDRATLHYGTHVLLDAVDLTLQGGERIGLLGRNGAGKSTLLDVINGNRMLDSGERWVRDGVRIACLEQDLPHADEQDAYDVVAQGLAGVGTLLAQYHHAVNDGDMQALERIQQELEAQDGWRFQQRVEAIISRLQLPGEARMVTLSGGWRRRVALGRALVGEPDILLLDEPTNHLDIPAIEWLEQQLRAWSGTVIFVTHDRAFLQSVATVIMELDRGKLSCWEGDYAGFLRFREQQLAVEQRENALFDKRLEEEEAWIRQGVKARRTRNEGRVRALKAMREERRQRRERGGRADFGLDSAERSGKRVIELENVSKRFGDTVVIENFSTLIQRGDRVGIVGANGAGKSTLMRIMLGELTPDSGSVRHGSRLDVAYFDQLRDQLDPDKSLMDNVCGGQEFIETGGRKLHAISYLGRFLFSADRARMPVSALSGGEQNRAILARLFRRPANLLVMDEPTNDLDVETLELLEEILLDFDGTVLLVSHDREFMDRVVTGIIVLHGEGRISEHVGGYSDWIDRGGSLVSLEKPEPRARERKEKTTAAVQPGAESARKKLSYKDQRELDALPGLIEQLESRQAELEKTLSDPDFYRQAQEKVQPVVQETKEIGEQLQAAYLRWEELE